jgi:hypothetical protein
MGQAGLSLAAPYYASTEQVLTSWLPGSTRILEIGLEWEGTAGTGYHMPWGAMDGLNSSVTKGCPGSRACAGMRVRTPT